MNIVLRLLKATVEFLWWGGWWGLQSHFHVQPNYSVEVVLLVVLCCRWGCDNRFCQGGLVCWWSEGESGKNHLSLVEAVAGTELGNTNIIVYIIINISQGWYEIKPSTSTTSAKENTFSTCL